MNAKSRARAGILLVLLALVAAACAGATPEPVVVTQVVERVVTQVVEGETVVETVVVEVTPQAPAQDQTRAEQLNIAINGPIADPTNLNLYAPGVSRSNTGLHQVIYEYFFYNNLQTGEFIPWLATDYAYNEDFTSITVNLREGVTWSDGEAFNADDVVFTYDLLRDNPGMVWSEEANRWVESVEKVDDLTVTFHLTEANPRYHLIREAFPAVGIWGGITILPQHMWEGEDPLTFKNNPPISTGPYRLANASQNVMTYERRDDWWGTEVFGVQPAPKFINFMYVGPSTSVALALAADELDSPNIGILSLADFLSVKDRNPNLEAWSDGAPYAWLDPCPRALMVQNATPPWDQKEARWALSYMIDRDQIVELAYEGTTVPSWGIWPFYDGLDPFFDAIADLRDQYPTNTQDLAQAEELLTSVGLSKNADGVWTMNGSPLELTYLVNAASDEEMKVSAVLADQLEAAGLQVNVQPLSGPPQEDARLRGQYDIALQAMCPGFIFDNLELFHSSFYVPLGEPAPWFERNSFRYQNPELDAIVDEMAQTPPDDEAALIQQYQEAMAIWFEDLPVIPMFQAPALVPFTSTYWEGWPTADDPWNMPVSWWATFNLVINGYPSPDTGEWVGGIRPAGG
ncbi:MAG TPA: ABC transporter substrate-binding protein [Anaerolineales bacterium]|nr:ABC transporter substrate-binding protein [Anaerolineales bacterium]